MSALNKTFLSNVAIVSFGPIFASVLGFFAEPWIARYWDPRIWGIGSYYNSIINAVSVLLFLRYNFAIVQAKDKDEAHNILALCLVLFIVLLLILVPLYDILVRSGSNDFPFAKYKALIFLSSAFAALSVLFRFWYSGQKKFIVISASMMIMSLSNTILLLVFGALGKVSEANMINIRVFSTSLVGVSLMLPYLFKEFRETIKVVSLKRIIEVAKRHYRYPLYEFWGFAAGTIAFSLPVILVTKYWGQEMNGLYSKSYNLLYMMVILVGNSVNRVLHKEVADILNSKGDAAELLRQTCMGILKFTLLPTLFLVLLGPEFFTILLGQRWELSGVFAQYLSIWTLAILVSTAFSPLFGLYNKQKQSSVFAVLSLIIMAAILVFMGRRQTDIVLTMAVFATVNFLVLMLKSAYILNVAKVQMSRLYKAAAQLVLQMIPFALVMIILKQFVKLGPLSLLAFGGVLSMPYLYLFYIRKSAMLNIATGIVSRKLNDRKSNKVK